MAGAGAPVGTDGGAAAGGHPGPGAALDGTGNVWAGTLVRDVPCSVAEVGRARRELGRLLDRRGVDPDQGDTVLLVAHELVINGVEHARTPVRLTVSVRARAVHIEVRDGSPLPPRLQPFDTTAARGRGLQMVAQLSDRWGWHPDGAGKTVWAEVPVGGSPDPAA